MRERERKKIHMERGDREKEEERRSGIQMFHFVGGKKKVKHLDLFEKKGEFQSLTSRFILG